MFWLKTMRSRRITVFIAALIVVLLFDTNCAMAATLISTTDSEEGYYAPGVEYKVIPGIIYNLGQSGEYVNPLDPNLTGDHISPIYVINRYTPIRRDTGKHALVGCGPLAMATLMNYHEWPAGYGLQSGRMSYGMERLAVDIGTIANQWIAPVNPPQPNVNYYAANEETGMKIMSKARVLEILGYGGEVTTIDEALTPRQRATDLYNQVKKEIDKGYPVLLDVNSSLETGDVNHGILVAGYKKVSTQIINGVTKVDLYLYVIMGWGNNNPLIPVQLSQQTGWWHIDAKYLFAPPEIQKYSQQKYDLSDVYIWKVRPVKGHKSDTVFEDISTKHWAYPFAWDLYQKGIINGRCLGDRKFLLPDIELPKAEAVLLINRAFGSSLRESSRATMTRGEFAQMLIETMEKTGYVLKASRKYPCAGPFSAEEQCLIKLYNARIVDGFTAGKAPDLRAGGKITRGEAAKFIYNALTQQ